MNKIFSYISLLCLLVVCFTSCSSDNEEGIGGNTPILLSALRVDGTETRSVITGGQALLENMEVGVYIREDGGTNASIASNQEYEVSASGGLVAKDGSLFYYPSSGNGVTMSAYYPYKGGSADSYDFSVATNQSSDDNYNASDLLYSTEASYARQVAAHSLAFEHKFARITYSLKPGNNAPNLTNAVVRIVDILPEATFNRTTGDVGTAKGTATNIIPHASAAIVVPQTIAANTRLIKVTVGGNDYYYKPTEALYLESGKSYDFEIKVEGTKLQVKYTVSDWTDGTVNDNGGAVTARSYRVGDYYPDPSDASTAKGIVFWIASDLASSGVHGKIVSLDEGSNLQWSTEYANTSATDMGDGKANMATIKGINSDLSKYPAFKWCVDKGDAWYLPAKEELKALYAGYSGKRYEEINGWSDSASMPGYNDESCKNARSTFNDKLTGSGGVGFKDNWYWSSSEDGGNGAWFVGFADGSTVISNKNNSYYVRAVSAF